MVVDNKHRLEEQRTQQMDATLWANWQLGVGTNDTLVCVGDFAMGPARTRATWDLVRTAPGRPKILVIVNHDLVKRGQRAVRGSPVPGRSAFQ